MNLLLNGCTKRAIYSAHAGNHPDETEYQSSTKMLSNCMALSPEYVTKLKF